MAGPDDYIQLPEMNLGRLPRRRRRPRPPVVEMDEPEAGPALTTELRERDDVPNPQSGPDGLEGIDGQLGRMRSRLGLTPPAPAATPSRAPAVMGMDEEDPIANRTEIGEPMSAESMEGHPALGAIPRTQLRAPQVAPRPQNGPRGARYGEPVVAGMDDIDAEPMEENAAGLARPQTGMVAGMDDFDEDFAEAPRQKQASAPRIPGVQLDPNRDAAADERDRTRMRRMNIAQGVISGGLGLAGIIGAARDTNQNAAQYNMGSIMGTGGGLMSEGPRANIAARGERRQYEDAQAAAAEQSRLEQEDRAFRRQNEDRRAQLDERRIGQAEGATSQNADREASLYDPAHPAAQSARVAYARLYRAIPPQALAQLSSFEPSADMRGMSAFDVRQQADALTQAWGRLQQANPRLFAVGRRTRGAGRPQRGVLAGLSAPRRGGTTDYGTSEGLTEDDYAALGIEPPQDFEGEDVEMDAPTQAPRGSAPLRDLSRAPTRGPSQVGPTQAPATQSGRPVFDRDVTREEWAQLDAPSRSTVQATRAYMRAHPRTPWDEAAANVNGMSDAHRSDLISQWGNPNVTLIPGWSLTDDTGRLTPARLAEIREGVGQADEAIALSREQVRLAQQISALDLATDAFAGHQLVQRFRSNARRLQTMLRVIDRTGVPTGDEQARAMEEAPEPTDPISLQRAASAYTSLPQTIVARVGRNMRQNGFARQGSRQRPAQGGQR